LLFGDAGPNLDESKGTFRTLKMYIGMASSWQNKNFIFF